MDNPNNGFAPFYRTSASAQHLIAREAFNKPVLMGAREACRFVPTGNPTQRCLQGEEVWYSDWGLVEKDRVHARLTWNPWFDWQTQVMNEVVSGG